MAHASTRPAPPWTLPSATAWCSCSRDSARRTRSWPPSRATTRRSTGAGRPGSATPPSCSGREAPRPPPTGSGYTGPRCLIWGAAWPGLSGGRAGLFATAYLYVCGRGIVVVRAVLELPALQMRRDEDRNAGAVDIARGRTIGVLERALAVTLVLLGQYGALGLIVAAKSLARFKALEDREFAEYFLIGTLASLLLGLLGGVAVRLVLSKS